MKKIFTKIEILSNRGCYEREQVENLSFINNPEITLVNIMESEISIQDKTWFIYNNGELSLGQKKKLSLKLVFGCLPIYENKFPNDSRVRDYLQAIESSHDEKFLIEKRKFVSDAKNSAVNSALNDVVYFICAALRLADQAGLAAELIAYAAYSADLSAVNNTDKFISYSDKLKIIMIDFINNN